MNATMSPQSVQVPDAIATANREQLRDTNVFAVNVVGGPGCGKTSLIEATIKRLMPDIGVAVIACDVSSHRGVDRMLGHADRFARVDTGERGTPDATDVRTALDGLDLRGVDLLLIENVGTLIGPVARDLGQDATAVLFSVAGGHDKAEKHASVVAEAGVVVLNKTDLLPVVPFDLSVFRTDVRRHNPLAAMCEVSALHGKGIDEWVGWLKARVAQPEWGESRWFG